MTSVGTWRRLRLLAWMVAVSMVAGAAYGALAGSTVVDGSIARGAAIGAIRGFTISTVVGSLEIFATRTRAGRLIEHAPFVVTFAVKTLVYGAVVVAVNAANLGVRFVTGTASGRPFVGELAAISLGRTSRRRSALAMAAPHPGHRRAALLDHGQDAETGGPEMTPDPPRSARPGGSVARLEAPALDYDGEGSGGAGGSGGGLG